MANSAVSNIGASVRPKRAVSPQALSGTTAANGAILDRLGFASLVLLVTTGATTGTPDSFSVAGKLQHGDASDGSDMADISGAAITSITAINSEARVNVDLGGVKRYVRAVLTPAFVGGTSPTALASASVTLGGSVTTPIT